MILMNDSTNYQEECKDKILNFFNKELAEPVLRNLKFAKIDSWEQVKFNKIKKINTKNTLGAFFFPNLIIIKNHDNIKEECSTILHEFAHALDYYYELVYKQKYSNFWTYFIDCFFKHKQYQQEEKFVVNYYQQKAKAFSKNFWLHKTEKHKNCFVNNYAGTSVREYFAESFVYFLLNKETNLELKKIDPIIYNYFCDINENNYQGKI
jgi:hypothetical protein